MAAINLAVMEGPSGFNKLVVLKQILPAFADNAQVVGLFLDEARLAARFSHTNIVQTNEFGCEDGHHYLAMEYLDGQPLTRVLRRLQRRGSMPLVMHLQIISDLLAGLHHAHELADYDGTPLEVVHCDVSPQNTFVTYEGVVKLVDFGVAKARTSLTQTEPGLIKGKLAYMPAEQLRGEELDRRADVFAVGVMLWEAATGKRPWRGLSDIAIVDAILAGHFPAPCSRSPGVATELEAIILKALSFDREDRYASAADLQAAVEGYITTLGGRVPQREIGKLIAESFAAERSVINAVIEEQLQASTGAAARTSGTPSVPDLIPESTDGERDTPPETPAPVERVTPLEPAPLAEPAVRAVSLRPRPAPRTRNMLAAALMVAVGVASGLTLTRKAPAEARADVSPITASAPRSQETQSSVVAPSASTSRGGEAPSTVHVELKASPSEARFFLDDRLLVGNPFRGELAADGHEHTLRIEAPGFVPRTESVTLDRNTMVDMELVRRPAVAANRGGGRDTDRSAASGGGGPVHALSIAEW